MRVEIEIDRYQRMRYQSRSGKQGGRSYKESLTQRNKNQKESRSKRENAHSQDTDIVL